MNKILFFTNIAPHYRQLLWENLLNNNNNNNNVHIYYGRNKYSGILEVDFNTNAMSSVRSKVHVLKNHWFKKKVLWWQSGVIRECLLRNIDTAIFTGEMYCLSTWISALICRIRDIEVVFWGHGIYGNERKFKLFVRKSFYKLAHKHLLYERRAKQIMTKQGFNPNKLYVVFNSLNYDEHIKLRGQFQGLAKPETFPFFENPSLPILIFIGRVTAVKKLDILIKAANQINNEKININLIIIGDGSERITLENIGKKGLKNRWIYFTGACYNEDEIGKYLYLADLCVSPGNIGLTAIHSLSFGTPVCTHSNLNNQMPEAETIIDGYNGFLFEEDNIMDLTNKIKNWLVTNQNRELIRRQCFEIIDKYYNPNYQLTVFNRLIENKEHEL